MLRLVKLLRRIEGSMGSRRWIRKAITCILRRILLHFLAKAGRSFHHPLVEISQPVQDIHRQRLEQNKIRIFIKLTFSD